MTELNDDSVKITARVPREIYHWLLVRGEGHVSTSAREVLEAAHKLHVTEGPANRGASKNRIKLR